MIFRILWWAGYIILAIILQKQFAGIDFFTPGFLLALSMNKKIEIFWLFMIFTLIQEGAGTLIFGTAILWYGGQAFLSIFSSHLLVLNNALVICIQAVILGCYRFLLLLLMGSIQDIHMDYNMMLTEAAIQAAIIPIVWAAAYLAFPWRARHER